MMLIAACSLMLMLILAVCPLAERLYSSKKDLEPCWFRPCSAPKIKSLGRLTTFLSAVVVAQHVRNLGPGCVLRDIYLWDFFSPRGTVVSGARNGDQHASCLIHGAPGCHGAVSASHKVQAGMAPWVCAEPIGPHRFTMFPKF